MEATISLKTTHRATHRFTAYACLVTALTLAVILWGAYVRASHSGDGCGAHWPLCNGVAIPDTGTAGAGAKTAIEYAHRVTSGLDGLLVLGLVAWAFAAFPRGHMARSGAVVSAVFIVTESLIGAGLVLLRLVGENASVLRAVYLSVHLTNTFALIAAMALTAWWSRSFESQGLRWRAFLRSRVALPLLSALALGVSGAVAALGATLFPENAAAVAAPEMSPAAQLMFSLRHYKLHPLLAVVVGAYLAHFAWSSMRGSPEGWIHRWAMAVFTLTIIQFLAGLWNAALSAPIWLQITHLFLADALWIALVLLSVANLEAEKAHP
ncbi:MAG TPA: COX15/CtaA family protein [Terriglobia bacterium]|nr:COX15/CtaA family protein [Terriglobia bacterium]